MTSERPNFIARRIENYSRSNTRPLACPGCQGAFLTVDEDLLWNHLRSQHPELEAEISDASDRSSFFSKAENLAYVELSELSLAPSKLSH